MPIRKEHAPSASVLATTPFAIKHAVAAGGTVIVPCLFPGLITLSQSITDLRKHFFQLKIWIGYNTFDSVAAASEDLPAISTTAAAVSAAPEDFPVAAAAAAAAHAAPTVDHWNDCVVSNGYFYPHVSRLNRHSKISFSRSLKRNRACALTILYNLINIIFIQVDVIFVMDVSQSVEDAFKKQLKFATQLVR